MIDAQDPLHAALFALLQGLTYGGYTLGVHAFMAPDDVEAPYYLILDPFTLVSDNTKDSFGQSGEINIQVVTRLVGNARSSVPAGAIAAQVLQRIKPTVSAEVIALPSPLHAFNTRISNTQTITLQTPTETIIRRIITVALSIQQL